jgi:opacity protein-like surface antigen
MSSRIRRTLVCACLTALAVPVAAGAAPVQVAPPGAGGEGAFTTAARAAAANPGCLAKSVIDFQGQTRFKVRHTAQIRCSNVNVRVNCFAKLFRGNERISTLQDRGSDRCRDGSSFADSVRYAAGVQFTQNYRYEITLKNRRKQWAGTTRKCPKRTNDRRTLICKASHTTPAPERSKETIRG